MSYSLRTLSDPEILYPGQIYAARVVGYSVLSDVFRGYARGGDSPIGEIASVAAMSYAGRESRFTFTVERSTTAREVRQTIGLAAFWVGAQPTEADVFSFVSESGGVATVPTLSAGMGALGSAALAGSLAPFAAMGAAASGGAGNLTLPDLGLPENPLPELKTIAIAAAVVVGLLTIVYLVARFT